MGEKREWLVRVDVKFVGAFMLVEAETETEARAEAEVRTSDIDTGSAEIVDWAVTDIEENL